jgi:hypothetical protein
VLHTHTCVTHTHTHIHIHIHTHTLTHTHTHTQVLIEFLTGQLPWRKLKDKEEIGLLKIHFNRCSFFFCHGVNLRTKRIHRHKHTHTHTHTFNVYYIFSAEVA